MVVQDSDRAGLVFSRKISFGIRGCHSEQAGDPAPEYSAGATEIHGGGDSNNISCAKSGCQCCRERAKSREAVIVAASFRGRVRQGKTDSFTDMFLHKPKVECEINM